MTDLTELKGVSDTSKNYYEEEGYETVEDIAHASPDKLEKVKYVGREKAEELIERAIGLVYEIDQEEMQYDPIEEEMRPAERKKYVCNCGTRFVSRSSFLAHTSGCEESHF